MAKVVGDLNGEDFQNKVTEYYKQLFTPTKASYTLSELLEIGKEDLRGYKDEYECRDEYFYLSIDVDERNTSDYFYWLDLKFGEEAPSGRYSKAQYELRLMCYNKDNLNMDKMEFEIQRLSVDGIDFDLKNNQITMIKQMNTLQKTIMNMYYNNSTIVFDQEFNEGHYPTYLGEDY